MRAAPPVRVTVQPPAAARAAVALLVAAAAAALAAWLSGWLGLGLAWTWAAGLSGLAIGWLNGPRRVAELAWDGQRWHCEGAAGRVSVQMDLQAWLLLRFVPDAGGRGRWLLPHRAGEPTHWHGLRVALLAGRPRSPTDPAGQPPLAP